MNEQGYEQVSSFPTAMKADRPQGNLLQQVSSIDSATQQVHEWLDRLENRLKPILAPDETPTAMPGRDGDVITPIRTELGDQLYSIEHHLDRANRRFNDLMRRIDL